MPASSAARRSGMTLIELIVSLGILTLAVFGMTAVLVQTSSSSDRTQARSDLDSSVALAAERVEHYLIEARSITIDTNGLGLTYKYPTKNTDGTYTSSANAVETTSRRLYVADGVLCSSDEPDRPILADIPVTDPETAQPIRVFSAGINDREIEVRLVSHRTIRDNTFYSAVTARIQPRNMPQP